MDKYEKLKEIKSLLDSGLLNQEEFNKLKKEILFSEDITQNKESKIINNVSKPDSLKKENKNESSSTFNYLLMYCIIIIAFIFYFNKNTITNKIESFNPVDTTATSSGYETNNSNNSNIQEVPKEDTVPKQCYACKGTGMITCTMCNGTGINNNGMDCGCLSYNLNMIQLGKETSPYHGPYHQCMHCRGTGTEHYIAPDIIQ